MLTRTDARGAAYRATYTYDVLGRLKTIDYADTTPDVTYDYDVNYLGGGGNYTGLLTRVIASGVTTSLFGYNAGGFLTQEQVTLNGVNGSFTTGYGYDLDGRITQIDYPSGRTVTRAYQSSGDGAVDRLLNVVDSETSTTLLSGVAENAAGQLTARTLGSGIAETRGFNTRNQLTGITASAGGTSVLNLGYGYGASNNGRIRSRTDSLQPEHSATYTFDEMNRLKGVSGYGWGVTWGLDGYGNRTTQNPSGLAVGRVGSQSTGYANNRNVSWYYDAAGNVTNDGPGIGGHSYDYDAEGRLRSIDGGAVVFAYDSEGRRIRKTVGAAVTYYFYGLTGLLSEFTTQNSGTGAPASTDRLEYRVAEQTGTPVLLLAPDGTVRENNRVFPYGELWQTPANSPNEQNFTTYDRENIAGLDYAMARFYRSGGGRFMSPDPGHVGAFIEDPQSWNAYAYALNDPIDYVDPNGTCVFVGQPDIGCIDAPGQNVTVTTSDPGVSIAGGILAPGGCLNLVVDGISLGNTCDGGAAALLKPLAMAEALKRELPRMLGDVALGALDFLKWANGPPPCPPEGKIPGCLNVKIGVVPFMPGGLAPGGFRTFISASGKLVPVPRGWVSRIADNGKGIVFQQPGAVGNANMIRIMEPPAAYPSGYLRYYNTYGQPLDLLGKPGSQAATHIPLDFIGQIPWPW